ISWQALELADFACAPELAAIDSVATAVEAENATLRCEVEAQPPANTVISWSFNGRPIRNMSLISFGRQLYVIREEESLGRVKTSVLTIVNAFIKDSGSYTCVATNRAGNASGHAMLHVYPREEFGPLTSAEIGGVVLGFLLTLVVLVGAVYMVMQQYQSYCQQRAVSSRGVLDDHADRALKGAQDKRQTLKDKAGKGSGGVKIPSCAKPSYETVVSLTKSNGHVGVDLVSSTNNMAAPFTELRTPPERPLDPASTSSHSVQQLPVSSSGYDGLQADACQQLTAPPHANQSSPAGPAPPAPRTPAPASSSAEGPSKLSAFEQNNACLVNAIASELEEKIANRVIENLNLRNRQSVAGSGPQPKAKQSRPLSEELDD
ncbi:leucine-rich repeat-containing protein 70-like, partial [Tropilaelaps mercedesae]